MRIITVSSLLANAAFALWTIVIHKLIKDVDGDGGLRGNNEITPDENMTSTLSSYIIAMDTQSMTNVPIDIYTAQNCEDSHINCNDWAKEGGCSKDPSHLLALCPKSCNSCGFIPNPDDSKKITKYGVAQRVEGDTYVDILKNIESTVNYMEKMELTSTPLPQDILESCLNNKDLCAFWAASGICESHASFMTEQCSPSCHSCSLIDYETRCPHRDPHLKPAVDAGELDKLFEMLLYRENLDVHVHSRPGGNIRVTDFKEHPWIITIDDFLTSSECDTMIELGYGDTLTNPVVTAESDGSTNSYCMTENGCPEHPVAKAVSNKISDFLTIPLENFNYLSIQKITTEGYSPRKYHNLEKEEIDMQCGPSVISYVQFLNDAQEDDEGGINFYILNKTISPQKGRAVIWPNVINSDITRRDIRTSYYTQAISEGVSYYLRTVAHLYDFVTPHSRGCTRY